MLVLARKVGESITVGDNVEIFIIEINENNVRVGIKAPREIKVFRKEIYLKIQEEEKSKTANTAKSAQDKVA